MKNLENFQKESEINFITLAEKSLVGIYLIQDGLFRYVNPKLADIFEYEVHELINLKGPLDLTYADDHSKVDINSLRRLNGDLESVNYEFRGVTKTNKVIVVEAFGSRTVFNDKPAILGTLLDVTERKKAIAELEKSEKKFKDLAEMLPQMIFEVDTEGYIIYANRNLFEATGYLDEDLFSNFSMLQFIIPQEREKLSNDIAEILNGKTLYNREYNILKKNGFTFLSEISASPIKSDGTVTGLRGFIIDKTESKNSQEQLRILSRAVQQSPVSVVITDFNGNIEYVNPKFQQITGYLVEEVIGRNPRILSSGLKPSSEYKTLWDTLKAGNDWMGEFQNKKKNGELYWTSALISPVKDAEEKITHFLGLEEDITERKKTEMELRRAKEKAEEMNHLKSVFLANMSHELRTPMIGILGYAETLFSELPDSALKDMAGTLLKSGNRLKETLNLILDLSRIEANKIDIKLTVLEIPELLKEVVNLFEVAAEEKELKLNLVLSNESITSRLDKRMFFQIIENLINNAIKYTNQGSVTITAKRKFMGDEEFSLVEIEDTGIGIPAENIEMIFEPFRQASEGYARNFEGTGLGLTITKKFVELLEGNISVTSKVGIGSKFSLKFPSARIYIPTKGIEYQMDEEKIHNLKGGKNVYSLLLVENDIPSIDIIRLYLQDKYTVNTAVDGLTALQMITKKKYSAILMDIDLGFGMNGLEVTQRIRKMPGYENVPIVAVTAYAMLGDKEKFLAAGCSHYISKPFDKITLVNLLDKIFYS